MSPDEAVRAAFGGRLTAPRRAVFSAVEAMGCAFTAADIAEELRRAAAADSAGAGDCASGLATVYRSVAALERTGAIERMGTREGHALFVACDPPGGTCAHHHHIVCEACGRVSRADCPLPPSPNESDADGFVVTRHELVLYGRCAACARARDEAGEA